MGLINIFTNKALKERDERIEKRIRSEEKQRNYEQGFADGEKSGYDEGYVEGNSYATEHFQNEIKEIKKSFLEYLGEIRNDVLDIEIVNSNKKKLKAEKEKEISSKISVLLNKLETLPEDKKEDKE